MKFIIKLFPEITIKSQSVRLRFIKILTGSIRNILRQQVGDVAVVRHWDYIEVRVKNENRAQAARHALMHIPGIHHILEVDDVPYLGLDDTLAQVLDLYRERLIGKTFCVRVKRRGKHDFSSQDVERYVGGGLNQQIESARVDLTHPQETVKLEIEEDRLMLIRARYPGLNGFPIGTQEDVLSLISGGLDSGVSSYALLRRGCRVHYCFFNLGGTLHEIGVKQMAYHLWSRFGSSHKVRFIAVDFMPVVAEILEKIDNGQMGVVLKRMMVRAASWLAQRYGIQALVTGEALGQVSSQTLTNLHLIDEASDTLILRPLIAEDKEQIIKMARQIGTEEIARTIPEFCGVISQKPTVKAVKVRIETEEANFDFAILQRAIQTSEHLDIRQIAEQAEQDIIPVLITQSLSPEDILLDIRSPDDEEDNPLQLAGVQIIHLPFYKLGSEFARLDQRKTYALYCQRGVMSRLQALYLHEQGYNNVKVYSA